MALLDKKATRLRRALRGRQHMRRLGVHRLGVYRSLRHIYAQVFSPDGSHILVQASTLEKDCREAGVTGVEAASWVGRRVAERALQATISRVAFDRSGYRYHGQVKALAEAARDQGLEF